MNSYSAARMQEMARIIEGKPVEDPRFEVCLKGTVLGFPATLQAINANWPFGVTYLLETQVIEDPNHQQSPNTLRLTISPRATRGIFSFIARILLFEPRGQSVSDKRMEEAFMFTYNNQHEAERFLRYPGVYEKLQKLDEYAKFSELFVKVDAGLSLSQPTCFNKLDSDVFRETFKLLGDLGQVIFEAF
ncbi:MAG TPA: hypothetical protein V6C72_09005 [Chroococcales cyanobacterium]